MSKKVRNAKSTDELNVADQVQSTFKRWIVLAAFCFITCLNAIHWIVYGIVQDVVIAFYNQSLPASATGQYDAVNWLSMVYMVCYVPLVFPAMFLLDRKGLRLSALLGALLTTVGACIKCASIDPKLFAVAMTGQTFCAAGAAFLLGIPARLSSLWFKSNEISTATSIGVFGNQLGTAIGFLVPPYVVSKSESISFMQTRFYIIFISLAAASVLSVIIGFIVIWDEPEFPANRAQLEIKMRKALNQETGPSFKQDFKSFLVSLRALATNVHFDLLFISSGFNVGAYFAIGALLNQMLIQYYPNDTEKFGLIGLVLILSGLVGAIAAGVILDKTKRFRLTTIAFYVFSLLFVILFTATLHINIWIVFAASILMGFFMTGYILVGFELASEITYPEPEGTACGLLNSASQVFGLALTYAQGHIIAKYGALYGNIFICGSVFVGLLLTVFIRSDMKRQRAMQNLSQEPSALDTGVSTLSASTEDVVSF